MRELWTGCGTALVTPFDKNGTVDEAAVRRLTKRQIDAGIHFLVPCGTTGESPTLTEDERVRIVELVARGRVARRFDEKPDAGSALVPTEGGRLRGEG